VAERSELLAKEYTVGLTEEQVARLAELESVLDGQERERAERLRARWRGDRMSRIEAALDRVEQLILALRSKASD
jgi:hypothetical protein